MTSDDIRPFRVEVPEADIEDLRDRLARTRWPDQIPGSGWGYGTDRAYLQDLCEYWRTTFDWRAQEDRFNRWPNFLTEIDGQQIHFIHARSDNPDAVPLIMSHGWPGSVSEFLDVIEPLREQFHVVVPSLPGYGWSGPTTEPGWDVQRIADAWAVLMARLGYDRYAAQGGDWGAMISARLAATDVEHVIALHSNMLLAFPEDASGITLTDDEVADLVAAGEFMKIGAAYQEIQGKNPQTLGYGLTDSPAGLAGWIVEKFLVWTDNNGSPEDTLTRDQMLTNISVYWFTKTINSSIRLYCESQRTDRFGPTGEFVSAPTAAAVFPAEIFRIPRAYAETRFNLVRYTRFDRGGHFAALEEPDLLVDDIKAFFKELPPHMHDLVIKGGTVVDGTGTPGVTADIAITDGIVTEVGRINELARETIDADGALVTPGFVDPHTHFDGQVTWDPLLTPTCWHGVTTVVMGNCGVGFAPVHPDRHEWLIGLMEGVEDIPGAALSSGIEWEWETFPEYLDAIERKPLLFDVGAQVPHGAVRGYVMGERGAKNEPATAADIEQMAALVKGGIEAGALGFSTSRTIAHMAIDGEPVPGTFAAHDELFGIGRVLGELGTGVFELAPAGALGEDLAAPEREMEWMRELSAAIGRPVTFALTQNDHDPDSWSRMLELCAEAAADGAPVTPQVAGRPVSLLLGLQTFHPFAYCPSWAPIGAAPLEEKVAAMRNPEMRRKLLAEVDAAIAPMRQFLDPERAFPFGDLPDYEPARASSVAGLAKAQGRSEMEVFYDVLLQDDGKQFVMRPLLNYSGFSLDAVRDMLSHPTTAWGLGDGGAHCGTTCDASTPTFMLTHWARDRAHDQLPVEFVVNKMTAQTAALYGLGDRGVLAPGMLGDVNVIDFDALTLPLPELVHDLPADARRFVQGSRGYVATVKRGTAILRNGADQGARPGELLRGAR